MMGSARSDERQYRSSSQREKVVEHVFLGELLRHLWVRRIEGVQVLKLEVDAAGYDLVLSLELSRIYTLRNQLVHGGATWGSSVNREQLRDCTRLMGKLVPLVIEVMMDHPDTLWGGACYPVVN